MDEALMYLVLDVVSGLSLLHFILHVQNELKTILGINLLTMTPKQIAMQGELVKKEKEAEAEALKALLQKKKQK
jgi:hypothetical protein